MAKHKKGTANKKNNSSNTEGVGQLTQNGTEKKSFHKVQEQAPKPNIFTATKNKEHQHKKAKNIGGNSGSSVKCWLILSLISFSVAVSGVIFMDQIQEFAESTYATYIQPQVHVLQQIIDSNVENEQTSFSMDVNAQGKSAVDDEQIDVFSNQVDNSHPKRSLGDIESDENENNNRKDAKHNDNLFSHSEKDNKNIKILNTAEQSNEVISTKVNSEQHVRKEDTSNKANTEQKIQKEDTSNKANTEQHVRKEDTSNKANTEQQVRKEDTSSRANTEQHVRKEDTSNKANTEQKIQKEDTSNKANTEQQVRKEDTSNRANTEQKIQKEDTSNKANTEQQVRKEDTSNKANTEQQVRKEDTSSRANTEQVRKEDTSSRANTEQQVRKEDTSSRANTEQQVRKEDTSNRANTEQKIQKEDTSNKANTEQQVRKEDTSNKANTEQQVRKEDTSSRANTEQVRKEDTSSRANTEQQVRKEDTSSRANTEQQVRKEDTSNKANTEQQVRKEDTSSRANTEQVRKEDTSSRANTEQQVRKEDTSSRANTEQQVRKEDTSSRANTEQQVRKEDTSSRANTEQLRKEDTSNRTITEQEVRKEDIINKLNAKQQTQEDTSKELNTQEPNKLDINTRSTNLKDINSQNLESHDSRVESGADKEQTEGDKIKVKTTNEQQDLTEPDLSSYVRASITNREDFHIYKDLDEADGLLETGNLEMAIQQYDKILLQHPSSPRAHYGKGLTLDKLGFKYMSNENLEQAIDFLAQVLQLTDVPEDLQKLSGRKLADRQQFRGWGGQAVKTLKILIQRFPEDVTLINELGVSYLMIGHNDRARDVFKEVLVKDPTNGFAKAHLGFILKTQDNDLERAVELLTDGIRSGVPGTVDGRFYLHLGDSLLRLGRESEARSLFQEGEDKGLFLSAWQRSLYNVNRLTGQPWWLPEQTPYQEHLKLLQDNWKVIRDEGLAQLNSKTGSFLPEDENLRDTGDWKQFTLYQQGRKKTENCAKAPETCRLIDLIPDARGCKRGQVKFSVMSPGIHVWPHVGPTNCRIRAHLGLVVPEGPVIRVKTETRAWKEGEFIIFDDSFEHEVWHEGSELRLVLIIDFWHPELTETEKRRLSAI